METFSPSRAFEDYKNAWTPARWGRSIPDLLVQNVPSLNEYLVSQYGEQESRSYIGLLHPCTQRALDCLANAYNKEVPRLFNNGDIATAQETASTLEQYACAIVDETCGALGERLGGGSSTQSLECSVKV